MIKEDDKEACIKIGEYLICTIGDMVGIYEINGEGGVFNTKDFEKWIKEFYENKF